MKRYRLTFLTRQGVTVEALVNTDAPTLDLDALIRTVQQAVASPETWTRFAIEVVEP